MYITDDQQHTLGTDNETLAETKSGKLNTICDYDRLCTSIHVIYNTL